MQDLFNNFDSYNILAQIAISYFAGILTSLTPCVYPLIPVTIALFGLNADSPKRQCTAKVSSYIFGMSFTYVLLGIIAASTGSIFGQFLGNQYVGWTIFVLLILLALYTVGLFQIPFIQKLQNKTSQICDKNKKNVFLLGAASGLIAAPCVGPVLILILSLATQNDNIFQTGLLLFWYSLGIGTLFFFLALYSPLINRLPKSGRWLYLVKYVIAIAIIVFSLRFIPVKDPTEINFDQNSWLSNYEQALELAKSDQMPLMIDFYADWCAACHEYDAITFKDSEVKQALEAFLKLKLDFTDMDESTEKLSEKHNIMGLPLIIFLDSEGNEIKNSRINGFLTPKQFKLHLNMVLENAGLKRPLN